MARVNLGYHVARAEIVGTNRMQLRTHLCRLYPFDELVELVRICPWHCVMQNHAAVGMSARTAHGGRKKRRNPGMMHNVIIKKETDVRWHNGFSLVGRLESS